MRTDEDASADVVRPALDHELAMIQAAIEMVAGGGSPRVVLSGLRFAETLLPTAQRLALESSVRVVPLWTAAEHSRDLAVEPLVEVAR